MMPEPIRVTLLVTEALDALNVPYLVGGSLASAMYGVPRATMGADIIGRRRLRTAVAGYYRDVQSTMGPT